MIRVREVSEQHIVSNTSEPEYHKLGYEIECMIETIVFALVW